MKLKLRKVDVLIIAVLLVIAGFVLFQAGYVQPPISPVTPEIYFEQDDANRLIRIQSVSTEVFWKDVEIEGDCDISGLGKQVVEGNEIRHCEGTITLTYEPTGDILVSFTFTPKEELPESLTFGPERVVTPSDEGDHYKKALVNREWWMYTAVFDNNCDLAGWTVTVSFNHMARNDLFLSKPDLLFVSLHSPDGRKYGGVVERERPLLGEYSFLKKPVLQATSSDESFRVSFEKSFVQGLAPNWRVHIEGDDIDNEHSIEMDLQFFATSSPYWTYDVRPIQNSKGNIGSYVFLGCEVEGNVKIDGFDNAVKGVGHHEHTWASILVTKGLIKGWDWSQITLENGWNIYYSNYYLLSQVGAVKESKINPYGRVIITTDQGDTLTVLDDVEVNILNSEKIFLLRNMPLETQVLASAGATQIILKSYDIKLDLSITAENTNDLSWDRLTNVGMKIGRSTVSGSITWTDDYGEHNVELNGVGTLWNMRH